MVCRQLFGTVSQGDIWDAGKSLGLCYSQFISGEGEACNRLEVIWVICCTISQVCTHESWEGHYDWVRHSVSGMSLAQPNMNNSKIITNTVMRHWTLKRWVVYIYILKHWTGISLLCISFRQFTVSGLGTIHIASIITH